MDKSEVWPAIHAERKALVSDLEPVEEGRWTTPSLCGYWSVRDVLAHMTCTARMTQPKFMGKMLLSRFSFTKMLDKDLAGLEQALPGEDLLRRFKSEVGAVTHPPGPLDTWLGETIVHSEDIRRPLGITHAYPMDAVVRVGENYAGSNLVIGGKSRVARLRLTATDTDWSHGSGPEVSGPMLSIVLAMTGRKSALTELSGEGVAVLASRP
jgi:uncharacterized protein (TIGR03083 family)